MIAELSKGMLIHQSEYYLRFRRSVHQLLALQSYQVGPPLMTKRLIDSRWCTSSYEICAARGVMKPQGYDDALNVSMIWNVLEGGVVQATLSGAF